MSGETEKLILKMLENMTQDLQDLKQTVNTLQSDVSEIKADVKALDVRVGNVEQDVKHLKQHMVAKDEFMTALDLLKDVHEITSHTVEHQLVTQSKIKKLESGR